MAFLACGLGVIALPVHAEYRLPIVRLFVVAPPEATSATRTAVRDLCARSNVSVVFQDASGETEMARPAPCQDGLADAFVHLTPGSHNQVEVVDCETRRTLERRELQDGTSLDMASEIIAQVVCTTAVSMAAATAREMPPLPKLPADVSEPPKQRRDEPADVETRASLYGAVSNLGGGYRGGLGGAVDLAQAQGRLRPGGKADFTLYSPTLVHRTGGEASFTQFGLRAFATLEWSATHALSAYGAVGAGANLIWRTDSQQIAEGWRSTGSSPVFDPIASVMVGGALRFTRSAGLLAGAGVDVSLYRYGFGATTDAPDASFFTPARLRPFALFGLSLSFGAADDASQ